MSLKIAFFKYFYTVCFYTHFFNRKIEHISYEYFFLERSEITHKLNDLNLSWKQKDKVLYQILEAILELRTTNIIMSKIDMYNSNAKQFTFVDNIIYPPFCVIKGFGSEGEKIENARKQGKFSDFCDFKSKTNLTKSKLNLLLKYIELPFKVIEENSLF
jgi:DNA polymerase III alpha subunit (gram-positive type)